MNPRLLKLVGLVIAMQPAVQRLVGPGGGGEVMATFDLALLCLGFGVFVGGWAWERRLRRPEGQRGAAWTPWAWGSGAGVVPFLLFFAWVLSAVAEDRYYALVDDGELGLAAEMVAPEAWQGAPFTALKLGHGPTTGYRSNPFGTGLSYGMAHAAMPGPSSFGVSQRVAPESMATQLARAIAPGATWVGEPYDDVTAGWEASVVEFEESGAWGWVSVSVWGEDVYAVYVRAVEGSDTEPIDVFLQTLQLG